MSGSSPEAILREHRVIHMVGLSPNPERVSHRVAARLTDRGFVVIPIHPGASEVLGERAWPSLREAAAAAEIRFVNIFRSSDALPGLVDELLDLASIDVVWLQLGVRDEASERRLRGAGIHVVTERCTGKEADRFNVIHATPSEQG